MRLPNQSIKHIYIILCKVYGMCVFICIYVICVWMYVIYIYKYDEWMYACMSACYDSTNACTNECVMYEECMSI